MSDLHRALASMLAAFLAWSIGATLNVPIWSQWEPGDRADITLATFFLVWLLTARTPA